MRLTALIIGLGLVLIGVLLAWPQMRLYLTHEQADGRIVEVLPDPVDAHRVRLTMIYDFRVPRTAAASRAGTTPGYSSFASRLADARYRMVADPVVPNEQAAEWARVLLDSGRRVSVHYRANDPIGTAFIISPVHPGTRRGDLGLGLAAVGLLWLLLTRRRGE